MKKQELTSIVRALIPAVKKMVRLEAKRVLRSMIKEAVENQVNKLLAEHLIASMNNNDRRSLTEEISLAPREPNFRPPPSKKLDKEAAMRAMGIDPNNPMSMVFDGISDEEADDDLETLEEGAMTFSSVQGMGDPTQAEVGGEGIPLAALGLTPNMPFVKY